MIHAGVYHEPGATERIELTEEVIRSLPTTSPTVLRQVFEEAYPQAEIEVLREVGGPRWPEPIYVHIRPRAVSITVLP